MSVSALLHRKEQLEQDLRNVEKQIYDLEGSYLEETGNYGNILQVCERFDRKPKAHACKTTGKRIYHYHSSKICARVYVCSQGWSGFMAIHPKNYQSAPKRVKESDRAFSLSSVTSPQVQAAAPFPLHILLRRL